MVPVSGALRRSFVAAALAGAALFASPAGANPPTLTGKVLQCDGSYATGVVTSHPTPNVRADEQSTSPGLKIGQRRLSVMPSITLGLWRFDGNFTVTVSSLYTTGCNSGTDCCRTWTWAYNDANGSPSVRSGQCTYRDTTGLCTQTMSLYALGSNQPSIPNNGCPASTQTLPSGSGSVAITPLGPLAGTGANGLSAEALQLNGATYGQVADTGAWDLPATYTLAAWVNPTAANGRIVSQQNGANYWGMAIGGSGGLRAFDSRDVAGGAGDVTMGASLVGGWHLVHVVRVNAVEKRFYVDGRRIGTSVVTSTNSFASHPVLSTLEVGRFVGGGEQFQGRIDDLRILNTAISDDDIFLEYDTQIHKFSSNSGVSFSTVAGSYSGSPANGTTGAVTYIPPEANSSTARWVFMGQSIDGESASSSAYGVTIDNSPPIAPGLTGTPTTANDITWSWGAPPRVCLPPGSASVTYNLVDAVSASNLIPPGPMAYPTSSVGENLPGSPNQLVGRRLRITDTWGSALSAPTSAYTLSNPAAAGTVVPSQVTTGSARVDWGTNGNPAYTRWLFAFSDNPTFATSVSTPVTLASDFTGSAWTMTGLAQGTTYYARVQSYNGRSSDAFGGLASVFVSTSFTTLPAAPTIAGVALSNVSIQWTWSSVPGSQYYKLFDIAGSTLYIGSGLSFTQGALTTNTQYAVRVEAVGINGAGARGTASAFTLANNPTSPFIQLVGASSITYSWGANSNPGYTFYEVSVTTDPTFAIVVTTLTVSATTATANGLFPGTTYHARVRSISGSQQLGGFVAVASTRTLSDPAITTVLAPPSAYVPPNGSVGQWHFDESTGTTAADSSGFGNSALLTCVAAGCVSTPTWTTGPAGLASAAQFSGLANGFARVPDKAQYNFNNSITVSAWVYPDTTAQPAGAGIVVRGSGTFENFALDFNGGLWRWRPGSTGTAVLSTNSIVSNAWTHLIGSYNSLTGGTTIFINGRPASTATSPLVRTAANHDISIGNRQSASAAYDRGFLGRIDAVRVQNRALSAAEALAEYQGSFVSTISAPPPNDQILVGVAPNAFGGPATLFVSVDPMGHPISITAEVLNAGLGATPTGFVLVPNSIIEVVPIVGGTPFTQTLGSSASLSMPYRDADGDNIIDGTNPPLPASTMRVYTLNTTVNRWEPLAAIVDPATRRVTAFTPHFSVFALFSPSTVATSLSSVRVYPVPWKPGSVGRFSASGVTFDRLPVSGTIRILTLAGERVRELTFDGSAAGAVAWDGNTDHGRRCASGVYWARITAFDGATSLVRLAVER
ncbi:MAG: hypothetical protein M0D55_13345 [Elusimicrobiota bacterium]|nr:MAG: hypothetical protein M0D55_13345 [Elusimicrobiota bacterium]